MGIDFSKFSKEIQAKIKSALDDKISPNKIDAAELRAMNLEKEIANQLMQELCGNSKYLGDGYIKMQNKNKTLILLDKPENNSFIPLTSDSLDYYRTINNDVAQGLYNDGVLYLVDSKGRMLKDKFNNFITERLSFTSAAEEPDDVLGNFEVIENEPPERTNRRFAIALVRSMYNEVIGELQVILSQMGVLDAGLWREMLGMGVQAIADLKNEQEMITATTKKKIERIEKDRDNICDSLNELIDSPKEFEAKFYQLLGKDYKDRAIQELREIQHEQAGKDSKTKFKECVSRFEELYPDNNISQNIESWKDSVEFQKTVDEIANIIVMFVMTGGIGKIFQGSVQTMAKNILLAAAKGDKKTVIANFAKLAPEVQTVWESLAKKEFGVAAAQITTPMVQSSATMGTWEGAKAFLNGLTNAEELSPEELLQRTLDGLKGGVEMGAIMGGLEVAAITPAMTKLTPVLNKLSGATKEITKAIEKGDGVVSMEKIMETYTKANEALRGKIVKEGAHSVVALPILTLGFTATDTFLHYNEAEFRQSLLNEATTDEEREAINNMNSVDLRIEFAKTDFMNQVKGMATIEGVGIMFRRLQAGRIAAKSLETKAPDILGANLRQVKENGKTSYEICNSEGEVLPVINGNKTITRFSSIEEATAAYSAMCTNIYSQLIDSMDSKEAGGTQGLNNTENKDSSVKTEVRDGAVLSATEGNETTSTPKADVSQSTNLSVKQKANYLMVYSQLKLSGIPNDIIGIVKSIYEYNTLNSIYIDEADLLNFANILKTDRSLLDLANRLISDNNIKKSDVIKIIDMQAEYPNKKDLDVIIEIYRNAESPFIKDYKQVLEVMLTKEVNEDLHNLLKLAVNDKTTSPEILKALVNDVVWSETEHYPLHDYHRSYWQLIDMESIIPANYKEYLEKALDKLSVQIDNNVEQKLGRLNDLKEKSPREFVEEMERQVFSIEYSLGKNRMIKEEDVQILKFRLARIKVGECTDIEGINKTYEQIVSILNQIKSKTNPIKNSQPGYSIPNPNQYLARFTEILEQENIPYKTKVKGEFTILQIPSGSTPEKVDLYKYDKNGQLVDQKLECILKSAENGKETKSEQKTDAVNVLQSKNPQKDILTGSTDEGVKEGVIGSKHSANLYNENATTYNDAVARLKSSNSAREITTSDGEKIIIYHRNALNLGDYTYAKFNQKGILTEQGTIAANKFAEKFGISIDSSTRLNNSGTLMMSLDMGIIESLARTVKLNYDHNKFVVAKTPIEKLAIMFGIDVNDTKAMQKLQADIDRIEVKEGSTLEEEVNALLQIKSKNGINEKINELRNKCTHVVTSVFKVNGNKEVTFEIFLGSKEASNDAYYVLNKDTGVLYYAKYPRMPELEILAANIYRLAGLKVPNIELFSSPDGKIGVLSEYIPNLEGIKAPNKSLYEGFAVDALLANHDVIGADHKNSMTDGTNVYRIDMGCSFDRRGKGLKKEYSAIVKEIVSLMHPDINIDGADIFTEMTREDLIKSLEKVCNIDEKALEKLFDTETKKQFLSIVKKRIVYLKEFLNHLKTTPQGNMPLIDYLQSMQKTLTPAENTKINLVDAQNNKVQTKRVIIQDETTINKNDINLRDNVLNMKDQNGKFKRLVHAMEHAEIGFVRQEGDIIITKISENTYRIEREFKVIDITPEQIIENIKSMFSLQEQFSSHIELMYQAGEMSTELLNQIYDTVLKSKDCPLEYQKCINDFKRGGYIDINRLCNGDDMSYLESKKGLSTSGLVPKTIAGLKKDITKLSQFLEYFKTNSQLSLYRVDSYSVIEKIIIQSGKFKGEKLVNVLKNSNGKLSIDDINNIINNISDFEQKSFLSTTIDKNLLIGENPIPIMSEEVAGASRDIIWNFTTKGEITGVFIEPFKTILSEENYEGEFLLQRNSKIHITDIKYNTTLGKWEISAQIYQ